MTTSRPEDPPAAGSIRISGDDVEIFDGQMWVPHRRITEIDDEVLFRGDSAQRPDPPRR